ncbi:hypothetical protein K501DRAFT_296041 [Backusella circina FSU 941]|nr:hypothetical protein K501DRAFT_296041 [Backusella circina FSU 941]
MSRSAFVKNTMDAIQVQIDSPADQSDGLAGGYSFQSLEWIPLQRTSSNQSTYSNRSSNYSASIDLSRLYSPTTPVTAASFGTRVWCNEMKGILKEMYSNIKNHQITTPSSLLCTPIYTSGRVSAVFKRSIGNIMFKGTQDLVLSSNQVHKTSPIPISPVSTVSTQQPRGSFSRRASISSAHSSISSSFAHYQTLGTHLQNTELPTVYTSNSPYYKEGMVVRKHLLERTNHKAKHRDWKDCFMVIDRSQLRMYKLNGYNKRHRIRNSLIINRLSDAASQVSESSSSESMNVGGGDWMSHAQMTGSIDLRHTLANMLPSGYSPQRQHVFALQQSNGAVHLFQSGSADQVQEWVSTCNYWAARESKEPLAGGVSSMEYGWGSCLGGGDYILHEWHPPAVPTISSMLEEASQLEALMKHVKALDAELDRHRELKSKMECHFYGHKSAAKAMSNWEKKSLYLLHEIIKYQNYCDSIEKSLLFQSKVMSY